MRFEEIIKDVLAGKTYRRMVDGKPRIVHYLRRYDHIVFEFEDPRVQYDAWEALDELVRCPTSGDFTAHDWEECP